MDDINGLSNPFGAFFRKKTIPSPHNGFASYQSIINASRKLGYKIEKDNLSNYLLGVVAQQINPNNAGVDTSGQFTKIDIPYRAPFNVEWILDPQLKIYKRSRGNIAEKDRTTGQQITAVNVVVLKTQSSFNHEQYINVKTTGRGVVQIYNNGNQTDGFWIKDPSSLKSELRFVDASGKDIDLVPGKTWIEIVTN